MLKIVSLKKRCDDVFALLSLASILMSVPALAAQALLVKHSGSGFVPPEYRRFEHCELFDEKVVVTSSFADVTTTETRYLKVSGNLKALLDRAASEPEQRSSNHMCDGPATSVLIPAPQAPFVIFNTGGCGTDALRREGPASLAITALIDQYCPTTFQPPQE